MVLVQLVNRISPSLDNKELTIGVFIDVSKAFDTVDLNTKVQAHGVSGTELDTNKQYVVWNGADSTCSHPQCGVPQGSILLLLLPLMCT